MSKKKKTSEMNNLFILCLFLLAFVGLCQSKLNANDLNHQRDFLNRQDLKREMLDMSSLLASLQSGPTDCYDYLAPNTTADIIDQTIPRYDPSFYTYEDYTTYAFAYMNSYLPCNMNKKWSNGLTMALRLALDYYGAGITSTFALNSDILTKYLANYTIVDTFTKVVDSFESSSYNRDYQWYDMNLYSMVMKSGSKYLAVACTCTNDTTKVLCGVVTASSVTPYTNITSAKPIIMNLNTTAAQCVAYKNNPSSLLCSSNTQVGCGSVQTNALSDPIVSISKCFNSTTQCTECRNNKFGNYCTQCAKGYILNVCRSDCLADKRIVTMPANCAQINNSGVCVLCSDTTKFFLNSSNTCQLKCSTANTNSDGTCSKCDGGFLYKGACLDSCPTSTTINSTNKTCDSGCTSNNCARCDYDANKNPVCVNCNSQYCSVNCTDDKPVQYLDNNNIMHCIGEKECPSYGFIQNTTVTNSDGTISTQKICRICSSTLCTNCQPSLDSVGVSCQSCQNDMFGHPTINYLDGCKSVCPAYYFYSGNLCMMCPNSGANYKNNDKYGKGCLECTYDSVYSMHFCSRCDKGYYLLNGDCVKNCTGVRQFYVVNSDESNTCVSICPTGLYANADGKCVQACDSGSFLDSVSRRCIKCSDKIDDCQQCSQNTNTNAITLTNLECAKCGSAKPYLSNNKQSCQVKCPNRQVALVATDFKICLKCPDNCQSCNLYQGLIPSCTQCDDGFINAGIGSFNLCVASCPYGTVLDNGKCAINCSVSNQGPDLANNKVCRTCKNPGCLRCQDNYKICTQCDSGLYLYSLVPNKFPSDDMGCSNACDDQYTCMSSGSCIVTPDRSYRNSTNQCAVCPSYTSKCNYKNGQIQSLSCDFGYCYSNTTSTCQDPRTTNQVYIKQLDNLTQGYRDICLDKCPSGYVTGPLNKCISCDSTNYPQCKTTNCLKWDLVSTFWESNIPSCIKCASGYILNDNGCSLKCPFTGIIRGNNQNQYCFDCPDNQIPLNNTCTDCSTAIQNCAKCGTNDGVTAYCNQCNVGYQLSSNSKSQCVASTCGVTYLKSDGSGCTISCNAGEYQDDTKKQCTKCSISNCLECLGTYSGSPICLSCGVYKSSNGTTLPYYLSVNKDSCLTSCPAGQISDSKKNCVEGPSNAQSFTIVTEIDCGLAKYINSNYMDGCGDILNSTSCNSGYYLMKKLNTNANVYFCGQCQTGWYYDATSLTCVQCGNYCLSCSTTNLGTCDKCDPQENTMTFNGKCYKNCPKGSYQSGTSCIACDSSCASCTGSSSSECTSCPINSNGDYASFLFVDIQKMTKTCVTTCPSDFVMSSNGKCIQVTKASVVGSTLCTSDCLQCTTDPATLAPKCASCSNGYVPNGIGCQQICDSTQYAIDDCTTCPNRVECKNCPPKTLFANKLDLQGNCVYTACPGTNCNECKFVNQNTDTERVVCTNCNNNTIIDNNGLCTTMKISSSSKCAMINCNTCDDDNQNCMKCADGFVISTDNKCITECPRGQKLLGSRCSPCLNPNYESCYNKGNSPSNPELALSCKKGFYLLNGECVPYCPDSFFGDELTRWCVRCSCDCSACNSYFNNCENLCLTGYVWDNLNQKCVTQDSSISSSFFNDKNKCLTINLPTNIKLLKLPSTGFNLDDFINGSSKCADSSMSENWLKLFSTDASIQNILQTLINPLNANERKELLYLYSDLSNRVAAMKTNQTFNLKNYLMTIENQFVPLKLIALYKNSILGNVDLTENFAWTITDFVSSDDGLSQQCSDIFSQGFMQWLSNYINQCTYEVINDRLSVEICMDDLSFLQGGLEIPLTDALYYVSENQLLPSAIQSVSIPDIIDFAEVLPDLVMPDEISQCEPFAIDFINSKGLGSKPIIEAALNLAEDIATGEITYEIEGLIRDKFSQLFNSQIASAIQNGASKIDFDKYALGFLSGNKISMSFSFTSSSSSQNKVLEKNLVITNKNVIRLDVPSSLSLNPNKVTSINPTATYYSCLDTDPLLNQTISLKCYVDYFDSKNVLTTSEIPKCTLNNTQFTFTKIVEIRVKATLGSYSSSTKIRFAVEGATCTCDLSQLDAMISMDSQFTIDRNWFICPSNIVPFYYLRAAFGSYTMKFELSDLTPKIISYLPRNQDINIDLVVTDATQTKQYGTCSKKIKVNDLQQPLKTKLVPKYYQGIQEIIQFDVSTLGFSGTAVQANQTFTLNAYGSSTNLITTRKDKITISKNSIFIYPGVLNAGTKYILNVKSVRDIWQGEDNVIISASTSNFFNAQLLNTGQFNNGDTIGIKISKASAYSDGINCYIGTMFNNKFSVSQIVGQVTTQDVTVNFVAPYLTKNTVVDYQIAVKCEFSSGTDVNTKSADIKSLYIKILTKDPTTTPTSTTTSSVTSTSTSTTSSKATSKTLTSSSIMSAITSAASSLNALNTINNCIKLATSTSNLCTISNDVFTNCFTACENVIDSIGSSIVLNLLDPSLLSKILSYFEQSFICYLNSLTSGRALTDQENTVLNLIIDANNKLLFSSSGATDSSVICKILSTDDGKAKLKLFDSLNFALSRFTLSSTLISKVQSLKKLVICTNAANVQTGSVISDQSTSSAYSVYSTTVFDVGSTYVAQVQTSRRNLDSSNTNINTNKCQATVMQIPSNLKSSYDVIVEVEYQQNCKLPQGDNCSIKQSQVTVGDCCLYHISSRVLNANGTAVYQQMSITPDLKGSLLLDMPNYFVKNTGLCAYYDSDGCWKTDGVIQNSDGTCTTSHLSTFGIIDSLIMPNSNSNSGSSQTSSQSNNSSVIDAKSGIDILKNSFLYIMLVIDVCLILTLFISNRKIMQKEKVGKTKIVNKKEMGYQKTVNDPNAEQIKQDENRVEEIAKAQCEKEFKIDESGFPMKEDLGSIYEPNKKFTKYIGRAKDDGFTNLEKVGKENPSEVYNVVEGEIEELENTSLFGLYKITLPMKHKLLSPFYINHPFLSRFSRFMIMSFVLTMNWIIPTVLMSVSNVGAAVCVSLFVGFILARIMTILLEVLFNKRNSKLVKIPSHVIVAVIAISFQVGIILISGNLESGKYIVLLVVCFVIALLDLVVFEFASLLVQVYICKSIRDGKEFFIKNRAFFKLFINPVVYDYVMS